MWIFKKLNFFYFNFSDYNKFETFFVKTEWFTYTFEQICLDS